MIRAKKRQDFEKHKHITDLSVIDLLLFKSHQDYQETMNCWKQEVRAWPRKHDLSLRWDR
jgi:NADH dehydrogenase (ubiquinone) 1 alpha subcomplex subunit 6